HARVVVEDPVRALEHVLELMPLEDVVVASRLVARPVLRVHGAPDRPGSALHPLDPDDDALLAPHVVEPVQLSLCEARGSGLLAHGARIQSPGWHGWGLSSASRSRSCRHARPRKTGSPRT